MSVHPCCTPLAISALVTLLCAGCSPAKTEGRAEGLGGDMAAVPTTRGFAQLVEHPSSGRLFLFGGEGKGRVSLNDMWSYDPAADRWSEIEMKDPPQDQGAPRPPTTPRRTESSRTTTRGSPGRLLAAWSG